MNQRTRTRVALVEAAAKLLRDGHPPSVPAAAAEALVSVATAYRYFSSAEALWSEAAMQASFIGTTLDEADRLMDEAGDDPAARAEVAARIVGGWMLRDQVPARRFALASLDQWFAQQDVPPAERAPVRAGRRLRTNERVVEPLRGRLSETDLRRLVRALAFVSGIDAMLVLVDTLGLDGDAAMATLIDANRWLITGALAELEQRPHPRRPVRKG